jgi:S-adenosylmethionine hydrolase
MEAAFVLRGAVPYFPDGAVHLVVVDPGVGTDRRPVALRAGEHWYVGPDNGLFPLVLDEETPDAMVALDNPDVWRTDDPSTTFHGRDIFAPAAAHLAAGRSIDALGSPIDELEPLRWAEPTTDEQSIQGWVVHVDRFGNCITNIRRETLEKLAPISVNGSDTGSDLINRLPPLKCYVGSAIVSEVQPTYGAVASGEPVLLIGSTGFLEVAVNAGNAAELLDIRKGDSVKIVLQDATTS